MLTVASQGCSCHLTACITSGRTVILLGRVIMVTEVERGQLFLKQSRTRACTFGRPFLDFLVQIMTSRFRQTIHLLGDEKWARFWKWQERMWSVVSDFCKPGLPSFAIHAVLFRTSASLVCHHSQSMQAVEYRYNF